jgi:hypothetical protein
MKRIIHFSNLTEAQEYKKKFGGWIFEPDRTNRPSAVTLWFSNHFTPTAIFTKHTAGESGSLL